MKTQTQYNRSGLLKEILILVIITLITIGNSMAFNGNDEKNAKKENKESIENSEMIDELLETLEVEEFEFNTQNQQNAFQIFDHNDNVLYSGSEKEWESKGNKKLITMKRKAEFLFESNGSKIYKVF